MQCKWPLAPLPSLLLQPDPLLLAGDCSLQPFGGPPAQGCLLASTCSATITTTLPVPVSICWWVAFASGCLAGLWLLALLCVLLPLLRLLLVKPLSNMSILL